MSYHSEHALLPYRYTRSALTPCREVKRWKTDDQPNTSYNHFRRKPIFNNFKAVYFWQQGLSTRSLTLTPYCHRRLTKDKYYSVCLTSISLTVQKLIYCTNLRPRRGKGMKIRPLASNYLILYNF